jgi:surface protein
MYGMFNNCHKLKSLNLLSFDTSKVTNMQAMFSDCHSLSSLDLTSFNTKNVTTMRYMFGSDKGITNLTNIKGIENFDTSSLTRIDYIFDDCQKLKSLDLSNWDVTKINDMNYAFNGCIILENLNLSNWNIENVTTITGIFNRCYKLSKFNSFKNINLSFSLGSTIIGYDSLLDVINNLKSSTDTKTLTISSSQLTLLNQTDINIATNKNWNVSI